MKPQLVEKVIKFQSEECPELIYENPLIDPEVSHALAKSFVKVLSTKETSGVNNNLRLSVLENIRKICKLEPESHIKLHEKYEELLVDVYKDNVCSSKTLSEIDRQCSAFLMKTYKDLNIDHYEKINLNADVVQSIINLDKEDGTKRLLENVLFWDTSNEKAFHILNDIWSQNFCTDTDDIVLKMKPKIEEALLKICLQIFEDKTLDLETELGKETYRKLFKCCAVSSLCFQLCSHVLNSIFISSNFNTEIQQLISKFVEAVKSNCEENSLSSLYPSHLCHIVVLLDISIDEELTSLSTPYVQNTVEYLKLIQDSSKLDFILLLSHYPQWFGVVTEKIND